MIIRVISKRHYTEAYTVYGERLMRFVMQFTKDEGTQHKILSEAIWEILSQAAQSLLDDAEVPILRSISFASMLRTTRKVALQHLKSDPLYDDWAPVTMEPDFFPLTDPSLTDFHKRIFYLRYYRDIEEAAIAERYKTTLEDVQQKFRDTLRVMFTTMKAEDK